MKKPFVVIAAAAGVVAGVVYCLIPAKSASPGQAAARRAESPNSPAVNTDPKEVFQRAFWKRPSVDDKILQAERREWSDENGVKKWQWFLAVEPSAGLKKHLREDNAFGLAPAKTQPVIKDPPSWFSFKPDEVEVLDAPHGNMRLIFGKAGKVLYATDSGGGFQAGAPEVSPPSQPPSSESGRLPSSPPLRSNP